MCSECSFNRSLNHVLRRRVVSLDLLGVALLNLLDLGIRDLVVAQQQLCDGFDPLVVEYLLVPDSPHNQHPDQDDEQTHHTHLHTQTDIQNTSL